MIAKVIGYGGTRDEALARLRRALDDTHVIIEGGATNKTFLIELLEQREVLHATVDTGWIDRAREEGRLRSHDHSDVALVAAAIAAYEEEERAEQQRFLATAYGGRPPARHDLYRAFDLKLRHVAYQVQIAQVGPDRFRIGLGTDSDATVDASLERNDEHAARLTMGGQTYRLLVNSHGHEIFVEVDHAAHRITHDEGGVVRSHAPALVVAVPTQVGAQVEAGAPLVVLESMKMETTLTAPSAGRVREVLVSVGHQVETGEPLVRLEPLPDAEPDPDETVTEHVDGPGVVLETREQPTATQRATGALADLRGMLLGYDLPPELESIAVAEYRFARAELTTDDQTTLSDEIALLRAFTDIAELSRNRPAAGENQDRVHSPREHFHAYLRSLDPQREGLPETFSDRLRRALSHYGVAQLERTGELEEAVFRIFMALQTAGSHLRAVTAVLRQWLTQPTPQGPVAGLAHQALDELVIASQLRYPVVGDLARSVRFSWFDEPVVARERAMVLARAADDLAALTGGDEQNRAERIQSLVDIPEQLNDFLADQLRKGVGAQAPMLEVMLRRHYGEHHIGAVEVSSAAGHPFVVADYSIDARDCRVVATEAWLDDLDPGSGFATALGSLVADGVAAARDVVVDLYLLWPAAPADPDDLVAAAARLLDRLSFSRKVRRVMLGIVGATPEQSMMHLTFRPDRDRSEVPDPTAGVVEDDLIRGVHPMVARRLDLWRLRNFNVTRLEGTPNVLLYHCIAPNNPADQRLVALAQIRELAVVRDRDGRITGLPHVQRAVNTSMEMLRRARSRLGTKGARLDTNHVWLHIWPVVELPLTELTGLGHTISPLTAGRGVQEVVAQGQVRGPDGKIRPAAVRFTYQSGHGVVASISGPMTERLAPMDGYAQKVNQSRRRGYTYPYELLDEIVGPEGSFEEYELDGDALVAVDRPPGNNPSGLVVGVASTPTERYPEGIRRVVLLGDPTKALGSVAEPECARMVAALDLAETMGVPVDWYALSSGARISMESGTENMDWVARGLRRIIEFTQGGGVINVVVAGINVGAQPYWNAEATMLMHTRGVLVMTPDSAMVLTGKQSLDFSGGVSAEDNFGIGGYDRVMGPNGQAQYWAPDLPAAVEILRQCHDHAYRQPGEAVSRPAPTSDPVDRDVRDFGHHDPDSDFTRVGEIFSAEANPDRKKPFDIRTLMRAVADADHPVLERWANMADADTSVVFDAHLGGQPVCLLGIESRPIPRLGFPPSDGPDTWTAGTLFPRSSKKTARAVNAASGSRPLVVLANLSGFDGSPESMRNLQLEYGAEIGRAVVNFAGPIVFCVVSRYHGGAFVVFSKQLNDNMRVLAVEGSFASVIGGAPAAAVVFSGEVTRRTDTDPRVVALEVRVASASGSARAALVQELADLRESVRTEHLSEVAAEFDGIHDIARAVAVGSVDDVISARELRPRLIAEVRAGIARLRQH
jgi:acetyl-CoA carboxylase carboxyltransferase component/biotin carboxyl carrier protein